MRHTQPFPALTTERLELRAIHAGDASFYHELLLLAEVTRFSDLPDAASPARATRIVTRMSKLFPSGKGCGWIIKSGAMANALARSALTTSTSDGGGAISVTSRIPNFGVAGS